MQTHRIAVIPGDGIGKEVVPEGLRVLEAAAAKFGVGLELAHFDWNCDYYQRTGRMMPEDWFETLSPFEAIFYGAVGWPAELTVSAPGAPGTPSRCRCRRRCPSPRPREGRAGCRR